MKGNEFLDKMGLIDPTYVEAASVAPPKKEKQLLKRCAAFAACLLLLFSALSDWLHAVYIENHRGSKGAKRALISSAFNSLFVKAYI